MDSKKTAKKLGFEKNDWALTAEGFVARLDSFINTATPLCEVWGLYHEFGSVYAKDLTKITKEVARRLIKRFEESGWAL